MSECLSAVLADGQRPYLGGGFGHFYAYAPYKWNIQSTGLRWKPAPTMFGPASWPVPFIAGSDYTIADMAIWAWYGQLVLGRQYNAGTFLNVDPIKCKKMGRVD